MKKMFGRRLMLAICLALLLSVLAIPNTAQAATYPCLFYGTAAVNDEPVDAGTEITAWVGDEQVGSALTGDGGLEVNRFTLSVDLEPPAEMTFKIGELNAIETATFVQYGAVEVNLTAYTEAEVTLVSIAVAPVSVEILVGETQAFTANGTYSDDSITDITAEAVWTSSDTAVATVEEGLATGLTLGTTTITATLDGISGTASLEVTEVILVSIAVTPESASILLGETKQFTAIGTYSDDSIADITTEAVWTSSDNTVATVEEGLATGLALGTATITAMLDGISESTALSVVEVSATIELIEGVNIIPYTGATISLPEALTNIGPDGSGVVQIIWVRAAWTEGNWLYYNAAIPWGNLTQLENGRAYIIVVSQDCSWEIPQ